MTLTTSAAPAGSATSESTAGAWSAPSGAALTWVTVGATFLLLGVGVMALTTVQQVSPGFATLGAATSFGRLRPVATTLIGYGGLGMIGTGVALDIARRVARAPGQLELVARIGGALTTLAVAGGTVALLLGHTTGRPGLELPRPFSLPLALGLLLGAVVFFRTLAMRADDELHPAMWHLSAGVVAGPVLLMLGTVPRVAGVNDEIIRVFATNGLLLLWLVSLGIGVALYVVPQAARSALHSRQLAALGFWGWVALAPFTAPARLVSGPSQEWLETIGVTAAILLVIPAIAITVNLFQTYARRTSLSHPADLRFALLGGALLSVAVSLAALTSGRNAGDVLRLTVAGEGAAELMTVGVAGAMLLAGVWHVLPGLAQRRHANPVVAARAVWWLAAGVGIIAMSMLAGGLVQGALWTAAVRDGGDAFTGSGWRVVADTLRPLLWARVVGELLVMAAAVTVFQQVLATTAYGDPLDSADAAGE